MAGLYGLSDSVGRLKNVAKMLPGMNDRDYINENSLPLYAERSVKVLSGKNGSKELFSKCQCGLEEALLYMICTFTKATLSTLDIPIFHRARHAENIPAGIPLDSH